MSDKNSVVLEVDPSLLENRLLINKNDVDVDALQSLLNPSDGKLVCPLPGFCIKSWKADSSEKLFINLCHTEHVPKPKDIADTELIKLLKDASEDNIDGQDDKRFRIPMSIGELRREHDKGHRPCDVCDVAINSDFFNDKVSKNTLFKLFLVSLALEGVAEKYGFEIKQDQEPIILKNCKVIGKIQNQMVQVRKKINDAIEKPGGGSQKCLIEEITGQDKYVAQKSKIEPSLSSVGCCYRILIDPDSVASKSTPNYLTVDVFIQDPAINSSKGLSLDVGEDRVLVRKALTSSGYDQSKLSQTLLDVFLPYNVIQEECKAQFNTNSQVLTVMLPVAG